MQLVRILISFVVVALGLVVAAFLMILGLIGTLFGRRPTRPIANVRFNRNGQATPPRSPHASGDVIDVEATPVKD